MAITPFGLALRDLHRGHQLHPFVIEREDGHKAELSLARHLQSTDFSKLDCLALESCRGRILDVGAGAGRHSLELQRRGFDVYSLERDECLIEVMKDRGVRQTVQADIFDYYQVRFDTIIMLDHGVGIAGSIAGLRKLLIRLSDLLRPGGQVIADSIDISRPVDSVHQQYFEKQRKRKRYPGETLACICQEQGWRTEEMGRDGDDYLVRLSRQSDTE
jgi:2-polyprenyl-3-methyl-5-hydroxy-6-metoxy-1,4-benzoquinol methylase